MSKGTQGCLYNCGDVCTKECIQNFNHSIIKSHISRLSNDLEKSIKCLLSEDHTQLKIDIEGENDYFKYKIISNSLENNLIDIQIQPKTSIQYIEINGNLNELINQ